MTLTRLDPSEQVSTPRVGRPDDGAFAVPGLALVELDEDGVITAASTALCLLLGRSATDLLGHDAGEFIHPEDVAGSRQSLNAARDGMVNHRTRCVHRDGTVVPVHLSSAWLPARKRLVTHVADLSDMAADRCALLRERTHHEALIEHSTDLIFVLDQDGRLAEANPATVHLIGQRVGDQADAIIRDLVHPDDIEDVATILGAVRAQPGRHDAVTLRIADGAGHWQTLEAQANNQLENPAVLGIVINARDVSVAVRALERAEAALRSLVDAFGRVAEYRDPYTAGHQTQVADLAQRIARHLDLPAAECEVIGLGASVHDIGKIAIPAEILTRPGRLSALEFEMVKTHCRVGHDILADVDLPWQIPDIVLHHHERLDGSGYPDQLAGDAISLPARIVAVADVIDAMASHRPYRAALGIAAARAEIRRGRGSLYDPAVADAALAVTAALDDTASTRATAEALAKPQPT